MRNFFVFKVRSYKNKIKKKTLFFSWLLIILQPCTTLVSFGKHIFFLVVIIQQHKYNDNDILKNKKHSEIITQQ